ncbi:hypothetical protein LTR94_025221, partial [Friedmanniomyces endolithicus]
SRPAPLLEADRPKDSDLWRDAFHRRGSGGARPDRRPRPGACDWRDRTPGADCLFHPARPDLVSPGGAALSDRRSL